MALKTIYFFVFAFFLALFSAISIDTNSITNKKAGDTPSIEFGQFEAYRIKVDGIKEAIIAERGLHYDTKDILHKGFVFVNDEKGIKSIDGDKIIITKKKVSIYGNGHFIDSEAHEIYSENAIYDIDKNLLQGEGKFTAIIDKNIIKGKDLFVDGNKKVVKGR